MSTENASLSVLYWTKKEVAERLRVKVRTIEREIASGHLARPIKIRRCSRFMESDLLAYEQKKREERDKLASP